MKWIRKNYVGYLSLLEFVYGRLYNRIDINANAITINKVTYCQINRSRLNSRAELPEKMQ